MSKIYTLAAVAAVVFLAACDKKEDKLPNIAFKTGGSYVSADKTVGKKDTLTIGIEASKTDNELQSVDIARTYDNGLAAPYFSETLSSGDSYSKDVTVVTRNQAGTEKYTFTITSKKGLKNTVSLVLTVN